MLWYKSWLDTRWRFLIPLAILVVNASGLVFDYAPVANVLPTLRAGGVGGGPLGRAIQEAIEAERTYRGFIWIQWFDQNLLQMATLFAVLLGSGSLLSGGSGGATFTLSLPASRTEWLGVRAALGLGETLVLALVPSLAIAVVSPLIGQHYALGDVFVHAGCIFIVAAMFFSLAFFLSTVFSDTWRPLVFACSAAIVVGVCESELGFYGFFRVMAGATYFHDARIPWIGLFVSAAVSAALLYAASVSTARRDF
jgi:hypothetical protein